MFQHKAVVLTTRFTSYRSMSTDHSNRNENPKGGSEKKSSGKDDNRGNNSNNNSSGVGRVGIAGALAVLLSKTKWVFAAAKLTKLSSLASIAVSIGTYSMFYGWKYAAGIVGLIYIHEAGHAIAMVRHDIKVGGMLFIPFMGAAVSMDSKPKDPYVNAYVALAGPVCGTMGALIPFGFALTTGSQMAFALADFGFMVNLFNMAPIGMLDGGRIAPIIHPNLIYMGLAGGLTYMYFVPTFHPVFVIVLLSGCYNAYQKFNGNDSQTVKDLESISSSQRMSIIAGYFGLLIFLLAMLYQTSMYKKDAEILRLEQRPINLVIDEEGELVLRMKTNIKSGNDDPEILKQQIQGLQLASNHHGLFKAALIY